MGYTTYFYGKFELNKELDEETYLFLKKLEKTRRMKRDEQKLKERYGKDFGTDGEFFFEDLSNESVFPVGVGFDDTVIDHNTPPITQPGLWCKWTPNDDQKSIVWNKVEKFYDADDWIVYLIEKILKPKGYILNGLMAAKGESPEDYWVIEIEDNAVSVHHGWGNIVVENSKVENDLYCIKMGSHYLVNINDFGYGSSAKESWSDLSNQEDFYKIVTFQTKEEASEHFNTIRVEALFDVPSGTDVKIDNLSKHFVLLDEEINVKKRNKEDQLEYGVVTESFYDFEKFSLRKLSEAS